MTTLLPEIDFYLDLNTLDYEQRLRYCVRVLECCMLGENGKRLGYGTIILRGSEEGVGPIRVEIHI